MKNTLAIILLLCIIGIPITLFQMLYRRIRGFDNRKHKSQAKALFIIMVISFIAFPTSETPETTFNRTVSKKVEAELLSVDREATIEEIESSVPIPVEEIFHKATVVEVIDGDTIKVDLNGQQQVVRLILVDTNEMTSPDVVSRYYAESAKSYTNDVLLNKTVYLQPDVSPTDKYGNFLAYVWLAMPSSSTPTVEEIGYHCFNSLILENGYAKMATYPPDIAYSEFFKTRQEIAQTNSYGLWNEKLSNQLQKEEEFRLAEEARIKREEEAALAEANKPQPLYSSGSSENVEKKYIGNKNTGKFHYPYCSSVDRMKPSNRVTIEGRDNAIMRGYVPCKRCNP